VATRPISWPPWSAPATTFSEVFTNGQGGAPGVENKDETQGRRTKPQNHKTTKRPTTNDQTTEETTKSMDVATLADLLHETSEHHDPYEKTHPKHNWWDWYAAYLDARERGSSPEAAEKAAGLYMEKIFAAQG
jgi:hypothetical protein